MCFPIPSPLTISEAGDAQGLGRVQREAVLGILDVGHDRHGVEVGLQGQLLQIPPGLHLWGRASRSRAAGPSQVLQEVPGWKESLTTVAWLPLLHQSKPYHHPHTPWCL